MNISNQELALWWAGNILIGAAIVLSIFVTFMLVIRNESIETLCAPASFEGKTVTNCIHK